jgi:hypothetical protein
LGEAEDLLWAPISGIIFYFMFGKKLGLSGGVFSFLEEITPGLDFIPTFTIAWFIRKNEINNALRSDAYKAGNLTGMPQKIRLQ